MAVVQISKIQHRRGKKNSGGGSIPQLAAAELGWAMDAQELYIGNGSVAEGAPAVGNTEILTEHTNIFNLLKQYEYVGHTDANVQTGEFANAPVKRTIQQRLDDMVSVKSFGAKGDGTTDDTKALQRAIDQLFINTASKTNPASRVRLHIPAGTYKITQTIYIPTFASLVGDGRQKTIIELHQDPDVLTQVAKPMFQTVDSRSTPGTYITYSNIQNSTRPKEIRIEGMCLGYDEAVNVYAPMVYADCMTESTFFDVMFLGRWTRDNNYDANWSGVNLRGLGATTSENILFDNCEFQDLSVGVYSIHDVRNINIQNCLFHFLQNGIDLGRTSSGSGAQTTGPRHFLISGNRFDRIKDEAVAVHISNNTTPFGHTSIGNNYLDVGNNMNGQNAPQTSVIKFDSTLCESIGDNFERDGFINTTSLLESPYKPNVDGYHYTKGRINEFDIVESDAFATFTKLPFTKRKIAYMDYLLIKESGSDQTTRQGRLTITVQDSGNIAVSDSYSHTGTKDGRTEFTAILDDLDSTAGNETIKVQYKNPVNSGTAKLTYSFSYFA